MGIIDYKDGSSYIGDWVNNNRTVKGRMTWPNDSYYEGDWIDGKQV